MNILRNIAGRFGWVKQMTVRGFEAAWNNRLTADWMKETSSIDSDIRSGSKTLLSRAKDLFQNNSYGRRYINLVRAHVVGPTGFTFQNKSVLENGLTDKQTNDRVEESFADWSKRDNCTITGDLSLRGVQDLAITHASRDGEYLIAKVRSPKLKHGFAIQVLEPYLLDHDMNEKLPSGNIVIMGVEFNEFRRPVAYHLLKSTPEQELWGSVSTLTGHVRVPASEIYHGFIKEWAFQARGISWMAPAMLHMRMLKAYELATVTNARVAAQHLGWIVPDKDNPIKFTGDAKDSVGNRIVHAEIGKYGELPPGAQIVQQAASYPTDQHEMFVRTTLRGIASALGVSYNLLANDLVGVNYSSIRAGLLDEREQWKMLQTWFIESLLVPIVYDWAEMAMLKGTLKISPAKFETAICPHFTGRRWAWVDPLKDIEAEILAIQAGLKTATESLAERGGDLEETYEKLAEEKKMRESLGLTLKIDEMKMAIQKIEEDDAITPQDKKRAQRLLEQAYTIVHENGFH